MTNDAKASLLEQAKKLSPEAHSALIDALHDISAPTDPAWEAAWIQECEDRIAAIDRGEMPTHDFDEVIAQAHLSLEIANR